MTQRVSEYRKEIDSLGNDLVAFEEKADYLANKISDNGGTSLRKKLWMTLKSKMDSLKLKKR